MSPRTLDANTVVPLGMIDPESEACCRTLEDYWHSLCDGRMMPTRAEVDPRAIAGILDRTFLIERIAPGVARFRLAGMHLSDLMGMEVRGMPVSCFAIPEARDDFAEALESVFSAPAKVGLWLSGPRRLSGRHVTGRMTLLPLRDREGEVTRALGCLSANGAAWSGPTRFKVISDVRQSLVGYGVRASQPPQPRQGAGEPPAPPVLRLIKGGADAD